FHPDTEPVTTGTGAVGAVKRKHARRELLDAGTAVVARQLLAEKHGFAADHVHQHDAIGPPQRGLPGVREAGLDARPHDEPVDHDLDGMLLVLVELDALGELPELTVDPHPDKALAAQLFQKLAVLAFAAPYDGRKDLHAGALTQRHEP